MNLSTLFETIKLDLFKYLGHYMPWLFVYLPYCPKVVRPFYCNLEPIEDCLDGGSVVEEELETRQKVLNLSFKNQQMAWD